MKWLAIGDSITFGVYSTVENGKVVKRIGKGWVQQLAASLAYDLTVMASRGMGYTEAVTGKDPLNASARIPLSILLERVEELTDDYDLITVSFGVNDYNTPSLATLETIENGLKNTLRVVATKWGTARIVVLTPFNCCNTASGTEETKWNCHVKRGSPKRSLADIAHKIKECCDEYGVECINCTENVAFNIANISPQLPDDVRLLPDRVHPSLRGHALIARAMKHYLI